MIVPPALLTFGYIVAVERSFLGETFDVSEKAPGCWRLHLIGNCPNKSCQLAGDHGGYLLNVMWPLTSFTEENGATRIWPGSQNGDLLNQPIDAEPFVAEMRPGDALLFLGSTLHCAGANRGDSIRRGLITSYCLGWLKPFENQWLCYPPDVARHFDPALAELIGYSLHRPNLGNYEGQSPSVLLGDDLPAYLAATDALRPGQEMALREFIAGNGATRSQNAAPHISGP